VAAAAGVSILGGHTIEDLEPKYGLAVSGIIHPDELITNASARVGDAIVLTKPLGSGAVATALKKGFVSEDILAAAVEVMCELNDRAAAAAHLVGVHAMTDVTGFGLLGHLHELTSASGLAAEVEAPAVPAIPGVLELLADDRSVSGGSRKNRRSAESYTSFEREVEEVRRRLVCDAMTSGGLLIAVPAKHADELPGQVIGRLLEGEPGAITVTR
jgi:selenide,water dikinase